ncbi:hypothetical protein [Phytohabitans houttuyneae]|uniref:Uncharacterized protein n=1 Tax=Phytohabitans houttuyneae TaxID=1076126 RepID=A0A6V8KG14_9ACTN|nr:hypothetical protein [Phytohabitans houttuyneae]GFJ80637.1 hypothetical protein Phou_048170 [Phytohabitans houttuyneae]
MTDDDAPTTAEETAPDKPATAPGKPRLSDAFRRRRRMLAIAGGVLAVLVIAVCATGIALISAIDGLADRAEDNERGVARTDTACTELERRLNRLVPPGATENPQARATAIRNENAAVRPFLAELDQLPGDRREHRRDWLDAWSTLVEARAAYAGALDRQVGGGEPAFFVPPQGQRGKPVVERLVDAGPDSCDGSVRRLAAPDL